MLKEKEIVPSRKFILDLLKRIQRDLVTNRLVVKKKEDPEALELISVLGVVILGNEGYGAVKETPKVKPDEEPWEHA